MHQFVVKIGGDLPTAQQKLLNAGFTIELTETLPDEPVTRETPIEAVIASDSISESSLLHLKAEGYPTVGSILNLTALDAWRLFQRISPQFSFLNFITNITGTGLTFAGGEVPILDGLEILRYYEHHVRASTRTKLVRTGLWYELLKQLTDADITGIYSIGQPNVSRIRAAIAAREASV